MGIKGIYKEIGPGKRVSLCRLAIDHLERTGRPLRLAIDFAIWSFQAQAARGGANPAIRTLFYRLLRLLSLSIIPVLVFDGPNKPLFKRNKRSRGPGDSVSVAMAKRLIKLFGFQIHDAPGEAEAECAFLQRQGVVDAVLSEDVDTIMFGCTLTMRNWSCEGTRAAKTPTHVSVYDVSELGQAQTGLDREGMVLVALMSGGDYIPEGVSGCGIKVACEAAKAGFGRRLCRIKRSDQETLMKWREDLARELRTNESKFFRTKHKAVTIPDEFPDMEVLRYYTHPVVSQVATIEELNRKFQSKKEIDIAGLRAFTAETFDWVYKIGAVKFVRVLAPGLLNHALMDLSNSELVPEDPEVRRQVEVKLVRSINMRRTHFSTDGTPELRVSYLPIDIVGIDLDAEEDEITSTFGRNGLALNSDDEADEQVEGTEAGPKKVYDPLQPDLAWIPETVAKLGVPLTVEDWEGMQRAKQMAKEVKKAPAKKTRKKASDVPAGALDRYVKKNKPIPTPHEQLNMQPLPLSVSPSIQPLLRPMSSTTERLESLESGKSRDKRPKSSQAARGREKTSGTRQSSDINPWTIASSQNKTKAPRTDTAVSEAIVITSSPTGPVCSPRIASPTSLKMICPTNPQPSSDVIANKDLQDGPLHNASSNPDHTHGPDAVAAEAEPTSQKHNRLPADWSKNPSTRRKQNSTGASKVRSSRAPPRPQASIKNFGRLSETMGKSNKVPRAKPRALEPDSDSEFEELHALGSKRRQAHGKDQSLPSSQPSLRSEADTPHPKDHRNPSASSSRSDAGASLTLPTPSLPSLSGCAAALPRLEKTETTRVYMPRTSEAGLGYFMELEVTREEADRLVREDALASSVDTRKTGGCRVWRQSEVSILDLTGED